MKKLFRTRALLLALFVLTLFGAAVRDLGRSASAAPFYSSLSPSGVYTQLAGGLLQPRPVAPRPTYIAISGDSGLTGITNTKPGGPPALAGFLSRRLRQAGDDFEMVGIYTIVPGTNVNGNPGRYNAPVIPWHEGVSGNKIEQVTARIPTEVPQFYQPADIVFSIIGINNMTAGDSLPTMLTKKTAEHAAWRAALPKAQIVHVTLGLPPASCSCDALRASFNAALLATGPGSWIAGLNDANAYVLDGSSDNSGDYQGWLAGPTRDSHFDDIGYRILGGRMADWALQGKPMRSGRPWPRPIVQRQQQPSIRISGTGDSFRAAMPSALGAGGTSWAFRFDVMPASLPASGSLLSMGGYGWQYDTPTHGVTVMAHGNTVSSAYGDVWVYAASGGEVALATGAIDVGQWHQIVVSYHASESLIALWIDGVLGDVEAFSGTLDATQEFLLGKTAYFNALPGLYDRVEILTGAAVPTFKSGNMRRCVEGQWFEGTSLSMCNGGQTPFAWYDANDGSGTAVLEGNLGTAGAIGSIASDVFTVGGGTTTWLGAGLAPRMDPRNPGTQRDWGVWTAPNIRQILQWSASASVTTASAQYVPPFAGSVTSTTDTTLGVLISGTTRTIYGFQYQFTGNASNVGGQTVSVTLYQNGSAITGASVTGITSTAGTKAGSLTFSPVVAFPGDIITASVTPSSSLTAALADVMVSVQGTAPTSLLLLGAGALASALRRRRAENDNAADELDRAA